jgi:hypothetical protein
VLEEYHLDIGNDVDIVVPPKLRQFCRNALSLCPGIGSCDAANAGALVLVESLNDGVVCRSRNCAFATTSPSLPCNECLKLKLLSGLSDSSGTYVQ